MSIPLFPWSNPLAFFFGGIAYNWNDTVPTLENPWTYDEDHVGIPVNIRKHFECVVPRGVFKDSSAEFIWGGDLDRDNRNLFRLKVAPEDTDSSVIPFLCRIPPFSWLFSSCYL